MVEGAWEVHGDCFQGGVEDVPKVVWEALRRWACYGGKSEGAWKGVTARRQDGAQHGHACGPHTANTPQTQAVSTLTGSRTGRTSVSMVTSSAETGRLMVAISAPVMMVLRWATLQTGNTVYE